ncbi:MULTISPECIES: hypothetical protein [Actinotignum]|uniref:Uncharacterized protein n=1 Tax=Actinotignum timonense TaxID=1870995 RepID=A0AAW9HBW9_9ACTO|nr:MULTISPECIES: hypothetical protein [Actinotignum]MDE1559099.1 hypothetical protein [Actinotignum schaalii]MDE1664068.1 hypothetical protein [Actinotignum schaalii]MDK6374067.1 hypothetical protein [Actinotignum timonense]MDK6628755.1 hypothetical protein [Actinotignum timonense]MDK8284233.1 hypothetical protein [Actinotignum timonense]
MMTFHCGKRPRPAPGSWLNEQLSEVIELCGLSVPAHRRPLPYRVASVSDYLLYRAA